MTSPRRVTLRFKGSKMNLADIDGRILVAGGARTRRTAARMRAINSRVPNGLVT